MARSHPGPAAGREGGRAHLGLLTLDLHLPGCTSLKEKRRILRGCVESIRARLHLSVAEVGHHDLHQRAVIAVAAVGSERLEVERALHHALAMAEGREGAEVCGWSLEWR